MIGSERIQAAERKKDEGNVLFKNGTYQRALKKYDKVPFTASFTLLEFHVVVSG